MGAPNDTLTLGGGGLGSPRLWFTAHLESQPKGLFHRMSGTAGMEARLDPLRIPVKSSSAPASPEGTLMELGAPLLTSQGLSRYLRTALPLLWALL